MGNKFKKTKYENKDMININSKKRNKNDSSSDGNVQKSDTLEEEDISDILSAKKNGSIL